MNKPCLRPVKKPSYFNTNQVKMKFELLFPTLIIYLLFYNQLAFQRKEKLLK